MLTSSKHNSQENILLDLFRGRKVPAKIIGKIKSKLS
jgi:hypothetical protein